MEGQDDDGVLNVFLANMDLDEGNVRVEEGGEEVEHARRRRDLLGSVEESSSSESGAPSYHMAHGSSSSGDGEGRYDDEGDEIDALFGSYGSDGEEGEDEDDDGEDDPRMPCDLDLFDDSEDHRLKYKRFFGRLDSLGRYTSDLVTRCVEEDEAFYDRLDELDSEDSFHEERSTFLSAGYYRSELKRLFNAWEATFVQHMETVREITHYTLDPQHFGYDSNGRRKKVKNTLGSHIFTELTMIKGLLYRNKLLQEEESLLQLQGEQTHSGGDGQEEVVPISKERARTFDTLYTFSLTTHDMWVDISASFEVTYEEDEKPDERVTEALERIQHMWTTPIYQFRQSEVIAGILFLTQQLNEVPINEEDKTALDEFRRVFEILWVRNAFLVQESHDASVLDDDLMRSEVHLPFEDCTAEDTEAAKLAQRDYVVAYRVNRYYITFCAFYFGEVMRRFYYYDVLANNNMRGRDFAQLMRDGGPISFERIVRNTREWIEAFVRKFPQEAFEDLYVSTCEAGYKFVGDDGWFHYKWPNKLRSRGGCISNIRPHLYKQFFSEGNITAERVLSTVRTSYTSRLFVLMAINEQLKMRKQIEWFNGVVVTSGAIEMSAYKLRTNQCPIVLQVFSNFYTYDKGRVYKCDNDIYKSIAVWFYLLNTRHGNHLHGVDLTEFVRIILRQEDTVQVANGQLVGEL